MNIQKITYSTEIPAEPEKYNVIVCGAGPSGICAAVSAARAGASVLLIERYGIVGGMLTLGAVSPILGSVSDGTMYDEICRRIKTDGETIENIHTRNRKEVAVDREAAKAALDQMIAESGVTLWLDTALVDALKSVEDDGSIVVYGGIFTTPSGLRAVYADAVIDCTGDGAFAATAGCEYYIGREGDGKVQPVSLIYLLCNVDESKGAITAWGGTDPVKIPSGKFAGMEYRELCKQKNKEGELPENVTIVRLHRTQRAGERVVNATQLNGVNSLDPAENAEAELVLRSQITKCTDFLRKYIPGYENCRIAASSDTLGVRETRRIKGVDIVTDGDIETGRMREDAVVHNAWFLIDIHNPAGGGQAEGYSHPAQPFDIPYGAFVPQKAENILVAGRCISGTHRAHAAYRVMAVCMAMGEAAGIAAALASQKGVKVRDVAASDIRAELEKRGVKL